MCLSFTAKCLGRLPKRDALNNHSDKLKKREGGKKEKLTILQWRDKTDKKIAKQEWLSWLSEPVYQHVSRRRWWLKKIHLVRDALTFSFLSMLSMWQTLHSCVATRWPMLCAPGPARIQTSLLWNQSAKNIGKLEQVKKSFTFHC